MDARKLKRTVGALAWPGSAPGAVVVLGQEYRITDNFPKENDIQILYHVLDFFQSKDLSQLIETARQFNWEHACESFYARLNHKAGTDFLQLWNQEQQKARKALFYLTEAPMTAREEHHRRGNIEVHVALLREYIRPEKKRLIFGDWSTKLKAPLEAIQPLDATKLKDLDYPIVSALAYCLAGIVPTETYDQESRESYPDEEYWDD
jgi:hypothetical protein